MKISCDIIAEYKEYFSEEKFNDFVFKMQDNNDGKLLIDIDKNVIKYAFLDWDADSNNIMDGKAYIIWNNRGELVESEYMPKETILTCEENIKYISENASLMTKEEVEEFINYEYEI